MLTTAALLLLIAPGSSFAVGNAHGASITASALSQDTDALQDTEAMRTALTKFRAGEYGSAAELFEGVTLDEPENGRAWYFLGVCLHASGDFATALDIHAHAVEFEEVRANASYNAGCASARLGKTDEAFKWLRRALDAGFTNLGQFAKDADLASLRNDPRFQTLYPFGTELSFQEDVEVLLELRGESAGDRFGWIGRSAGDVDGDGLNDILLSAPYLNNGSPSAGRIFVYSSATGKVLWKADGLPGSTLGLSLESIGDINDDAIPDQIAGAPGGGSNGSARAYSGKDGSVLLEWSGEAPGDRFGAAVSGAGDVDGDGVPDVIIGAPNYDGTGQDSGRTYVFSGKDGERLHVVDGENPGDLLGQAVDAHSDGKTTLLISGASGAGEHGLVFVHRVEEKALSEAFRMEGRSGDRQLGFMFVSAIGDVNNDGVVDVYGSDWASNGDGMPGCGRIYIHSGKDGALLHVLAGSTPGEGFGIGSSEAGDVDGDGHDDFLIGSWQYAKGAKSGGRCTLFSGRSGEVMATYTCTTPMETFGFDTTTLGDVNGDGVPDFLITNADSYVNGISSGRVVIIAGPARDN